MCSHADDADDVVLVAAVWVNPAADDEEAVYANNAEATLAALTAGRDDLPSVRTPCSTPASRRTHTSADDVSDTMTPEQAAHETATRSSA